jgi:hypothetical protein
MASICFDAEGRGAMLKEYTQVRQIPGERKRRWFSSAEFDLFVWLNNDGSIAGFELCYDKGHSEHSITWHSDTGFSHMAVDDGENRPGKYKATPIHIADGYFDVKRVYTVFKSESQALPDEIANLVLQVLETHSNWHA